MGVLCRTTSGQILSTTDRAPVLNPQNLEVWQTCMFATPTNGCSVRLGVSIKTSILVGLGIQAQNSRRPDKIVRKSEF